MAKEKNKVLLVDSILRHQVYLESVKLHFGQQFNGTTKALKNTIRSAFFGLEYVTLDQMTRKQLKNFLAKLKQEQLKHFSVYTQQLLNDLQKFMSVDASVYFEIIVQTQGKENVKPLTAAVLASLWTKTRTTPLPANGLLLEQYLAQFVANALFNVETTIIRAYANKETPAEALRKLLGTSGLNFRDGIVSRQTAQVSGLTATLLQHTTGLVQSRVASFYFPSYMWLSVLDGQTSDICRSRHQQVYTYGLGPLPPAHPYCRSTILPIKNNQNQNVPTSYAAWLLSQPASFRQDVLSPSEILLLDKSTDKASDAFKFSVNIPLTIEQFKGKLKNILAV